MTTREKIASLQDKLTEQAYLLKVLDLWAQIKEQGIDPDTVKSFGFRDQDLPKSLLRAAHSARIFGSLHPYLDSKKRPLYHTYVRLHDGSIKLLDPALKAVYKP